MTEPSKHEFFCGACGANFRDATWSGDDVRLLTCTCGRVLVREWEWDYGLRRETRNRVRHDEQFDVRDEYLVEWEFKT